MCNTILEESIADKFKKAIEPYSAEEVIKDFVYAIVNGDLKIKAVRKWYTE